MGQRRRLILKKGIYIFSGLLCLFILFVSITWVYLDLGKYPSLNECFKTSVSNQYLCPNQKDYVRLNGVSDKFIDVLITSEDDKFYFHEGFDWFELRKSLSANLRAFSFVRGGSTITQQLVKNVYLSQEKSIIRKIKEAILAYQVEKKYRKNTILEKYVNVIELGQGIYGVSEAAQHYFNKDAKDLNYLEASYLVVLLPNPVSYSKSFKKEELTSYQKRRIKTLLRRIKYKKKIDEEKFNELIERLPDFPWKQPTVLDFELDFYDVY